MRRVSLVRRVLLVSAVLITTSGVTASGASAAAQATGTVSGRLITTGGAGVAGAQVSLDGPGSYPSATTAADGSYSIPNVPVSTVRVRFQPLGRPMQYAYGKTNYSDATLIAVAAGVTTTVNDTLVPVGFLRGRLVDGAGTGMAGVSVTADPTTSSIPPSRATTDANGDYEMAVVPGDFRVGFQLGNMTQYAYGTANWYEAEIFTVAVNQTITVNDTLMPMGSIAGRMLTSTGEPVINAQVELHGYTNSWTHTDASGYYRIPQAVPAEYRVAVRATSGMVMYAPQTLSWGEAGLYAITAGQERTLDITLLPTGSVAGRFTNNGVGVSSVSVYVSSGFGGAYTTTNIIGEYRIDGVFGGKYTVHFQQGNQKIDQWARGKVSPDLAEVFTVTPGTTLTVDDTKLPTGSLRVTARDALTGSQIQEFRADLYPWYGYTENGVVTLTDPPQGTHRARFDGPGHQAIERSVTITAGQQTDLAVTLTPVGKVAVTVVDAANGAPVPDVCVVLVRPRQARIPDGCASTDQLGRMELDGTTGDYNILALPSQSTYGIQWVGPTRGTGDQREAAIISVVEGRTVTAPTIRLDRAGSITGKVTSETGRPLQFGLIGVLTESFSVGSGISHSAVIDKNGNYRLERLGPYQWPLALYAQDHAYQWSGGKVSRSEAQKVQVTAGGTATYHHVMKAGTTITGTVKLQDGSSFDGWLGAFNVETGDYAGQTWAQPGLSFTLRVLPGQQVKLAANQYWLYGTSFERAGHMPVGTGPISLDLCITGNTMRLCGTPQKPPGEGPRPPSPPTPPLPGNPAGRSER